MSLLLKDRGVLAQVGVAPAQPTFITHALSAVLASENPKTCGPFTCLAGDLLIVKQFCAQTSVTNNAPTGITGASFALICDTLSRGTGLIRIWAAFVPTNQTVTVSCAPSTSGTHWGIDAEQWRGSSGAGIDNFAVEGINTGTGVPSVSLFTAHATSVLSVAADDSFANGIAGRAYTTGPGAATEIFAADDPGWNDLFSWRHMSPGAVGSKTVGMSAPTGQRWTIAAVEVLGTGP